MAKEISGGDINKAVRELDFALNEFRQKSKLPGFDLGQWATFMSGKLNTLGLSVEQLRILPGEDPLRDPLVLALLEKNVKAPKLKEESSILTKIVAGVTTAIGFTGCAGLLIMDTLQQRSPGTFNSQTPEAGNNSGIGHSQVQSPELSVSVLPLFPMRPVRKNNESRGISGEPNREFFVQINRNIWQDTEEALGQFCGVKPTGSETAAVVGQVLNEYGIFDQTLGVKADMNHSISSKSITKGVIFVLDADRVPCPEIAINS